MPNVGKWHRRRKAAIALAAVALAVTVPLGWQYARMWRVNSAVRRVAAL